MQSRHLQCCIGLHLFPNLHNDSHFPLNCKTLISLPRTPKRTNKCKWSLFNESRRGIFMVVLGTAVQHVFWFCLPHTGNFDGSGVVCTRLSHFKGNILMHSMNEVTHLSLRNISWFGSPSGITCLGGISALRPNQPFLYKNCSMQAISYQSMVIEV